MGDRVAELERALFVAAYRAMERERLIRRRERLQASIGAAWQRLHEAQGALAKETAELIAAQGGVAGALGEALAARVEVERKERVAAMLRYEQANAAIADLEGHVRRLTEEIDALAPYAAEYERLAEEKDRLLALPAQVANPRALARFADQDRALALFDGVGGARFTIDSGRAALSALDELSARLAHASRIDLWDLDHDGTISRDEKLSVIETVRAAAQAAQDELHGFTVSVADFMGRPDTWTSLDLRAFEELSKLVLDDFYLDWIVESKVNQAIARVQEASAQVARMLAQLEGWFQQTVRESGALGATR